MRNNTNTWQPANVVVMQDQIISLIYNKSVYSNWKGKVSFIIWRVEGKNYSVCNGKSHLACIRRSVLPARHGNLYYIGTVSM